MKVGVSRREDLRLVCGRQNIKKIDLDQEIEFSVFWAKLFSETLAHVKLFMYLCIVNPEKQKREAATRIVSGTGTWVWVPVSKDENRETEVSNHGGRGPHRDSLFV